MNKEMMNSQGFTEYFYYVAHIILLSKKLFKSIAGPDP